MSHPSVPEPVTHVALSSLERSALRIALFDPAAVPAIRAGVRTNLIDADDNGTLKHVVAISNYPDPLWQAVAPAFLGGRHRGGHATQAARLHAERSVPDPARVACCIPLAAAELEAALEADHPDAMTRGDATGARIHCMHRLGWLPAYIAFPEPADFSDRAWRAIAAVMPRPEGPRWAPELILRRRALFEDVPVAKADGLIRELEASLWIVCEAPFACGQDFATYQAGLMARVMANPHALRILHDDRDDRFDVVIGALDAAGHDWRAKAPADAPLSICA